MERQRFTLQTYSTTGNPYLLTVTSGTAGTTTYANGVFWNFSPSFHFSSNNFAGQLVFGTSPVDNDGWSGQLRGLAIYEQDITAAQAIRHFEAWTSNGRPSLSPNERVLALYLFDEHRGAAPFMIAAIREWISTSRSGI